MHQKTLHICFSFFALLHFHLISFGQLQQPQRLEIVMEGSERNDFDVLSADEQGIIVYREVKNRETRMEHKYQVILIDTALLNKQWEKSYYIHLKYIQIGFEYAQDYFYLLFQRNIESMKADLLYSAHKLLTQNVRHLPSSAIMQWN
jgi:hypothetical protein